MSAPADKNLQSRGKHPSVHGSAKPATGKGRLPLIEFKRAKRAELDRLRKICGG
jgi:hypothetical protein